MVSLILLTLNRFELTIEIVLDTLKKIKDQEYELLICDNGSTDIRMIPFLESLNPTVLIKNNENKGVAKMQNELIKKSKGDYICLIGNDIRMPENWLGRLVETYKSISDSGIVGIHCVETLHDEYQINNKVIHPGNVFGTMFFSRKIYDTVGKICEDYYPYGLEDSDFNIRVSLAGFRSYYLSSVKSIHEGSDMHTESEYRSIKDNSLKSNADKYMQNITKYKTTNNFHL